ncbi:MAG TPA: ABC transporter substrate-binding protein [Alphaproteobacteria bacterium]|nr:ABC transporter substrate-binding protein [Alphaproteobacteria bacterium]
MRGAAVLWLLAAALAVAAPRAHAFEMQETPSLRAEVAAGKLPPVAERAPEHPAIVDLAAEGKSIGRPGKDLRILMNSARDTRMMVVYGYARLVAFNEKYQIVPDILESVDVEDGRSFTLHLRKGMRWSDGHPFTSDDFRYYWEDVANNKKLSPFGLTTGLLVDGEPPQVSFPDEWTVRYSWSKPNPLFLPLLASPTPLEIFMPAHYLKQFHAKYADPERLKQMIKAAKQRNWAALHTLRSHSYKNDNPDLPTLEPWVLVTHPPAERFVFVRNPYYYRFDKAGHQLPYIDKVYMDIVDSKLIPLKTESGETDLQARYLRFDDYTFLKRGEKQNNYTVRLWRTGTGSEIALYPNLNVKDPVWRKIVQDVRFRRALSLAINRHEINKVVYFGLATEGNNTVLPESPLFKPEYLTDWARFDLKKANALLDEMGFTARGDQGYRLLPDGRPMEIVVETAGGGSEQTDVLQLIHDTWEKIGIHLFVKPEQIEVLRERVVAGEALMSTAAGLDDGVPVADVSPAELAPTSADQMQWPKWGDYYDSRGKAGEPPSLPAAKALLDLYKQWGVSDDSAARTRIWQEMLKIQADQQFTIGTVSGVPQPVVVNNHLQNVPVKGIYNWDPGAHFGVYKPDTFWFDNAPVQTASSGAGRLE